MLTRAELEEAARDARSHVVKGTLLSDEAVLRLARAVLELVELHAAAGEVAALRKEKLELEAKVKDLENALLIR